MLQYPLPLPPLSLRSRDNVSGRDNSERDRRRDLSTKRVKNDTVLSVRPAFAAFSHPHALPISTVPPKPPSSVSSAPSSPSLPLPSPNLPPSRYISSVKQVVPSQVSRPHKIDIPSFTYTPKSSRPSTASSAAVADILFPGDLIGEGLSLQGEVVRLVPFSSTPSHIDGVGYEGPAKEFQVVRLLGTGSYAVVYHVREILSRMPLSEDDHSPLGRMDLDDSSRSSRSSVEYGREYAIKCLSKADLDEEALQAQTFEATIHQSLPAHPNIVTLYRTLETSSFLLLLLEYVPGEDLFYFLEQARDHYEMDPSSESSCTSRTPPTPSLLSSLNPDQLLSRTRLRLIASMFSQMCEAVATCHNASVFHRDIKPENFIVTDGWTTSPDGQQERKVVVKLSDFGLSTHDVESADMDCGSAPYMSYECRNNVAPTYSPRAADVWSLGIVLMNMLYHYNPWTDTAQGVCSSFELFRQQPINFFMQRFTGMTQPVARFLATKVFCIIGNSKDDSRRITAEEFGAWAKDLPSHFAVPGHARVGSTASTQGHPISSGLPQSRPASRQASSNVAPRHGSRSMSRAPSFFEVPLTDLPTVLDQDNEGQDDELESNSRSASTQKRRKRGARKGKGGKEQSPISPVEKADLTSHTLAEASQSLARELSRTSRSSPKSPVGVIDVATPLDHQPAAVSKKPSKWKLSFGKSSGERSLPSPPLSADDAISSDGRPISATVSNVTNLVMGLNPPPPKSETTPKEQYEEKSHTRGRRGKSPLRHSNYSNGPYIERWANNINNRGASPTSTRSARPLASSSSSMASDNWRSTSSAATSTSAFTRYSNGSVSTIATSVSSSSWRNPNKHGVAPGGGRHHYVQSDIPPNVKFMTGVPWELTELPRGLHPDPTGDIFGAPPISRKQRNRKPKDFKLDTISERPGLPPKPQRLDASTSTTDLNGISRDGDFEGTPKKVQKGQINALAKMLSALRR